MKKLHLIIIASLMLCNFILTLAQQGKPIEISPYIGEELDRIERDYFHLFPNIEGFKEAVFYLNSDSTLRVEIAYDVNGVLRDTLLNNYKSLTTIQNHILQTLTYYINDVEPYERGQYCNVFLVESSVFVGNYWQSKRILFLYSR